MNKLFGLFLLVLAVPNKSGVRWWSDARWRSDARKWLLGVLLALAFLAPVSAEAAARFGVCSTTCTWDNTSTAMWSTTSGGATGASAPTSADDVTFDANTCVGGTTCTITTFAGTIAVGTVTMGACTASTAGCVLDASANGTNFTISGGNGFNASGTGTRTINMGAGTWSITAAQGIWTLTTVTNLTFNANSSTIAFTSASVTQTRFLGGGRTYNIVTFVGGASSSISITGANTFSTVTIGAPSRISFPNSVTNTITNFTNISAASGTAAVLVESDNPLFGVATISSANNWTCDFCGFQAMTFSGGGTFAGTNSFNFGRNTGITITAPSGGGRIIGG